ARKPAARAASAVWRPTVNAGSATSASRRGWRAMARAAFALVITTALKGARGSSKSTASMRSSGANVTWWPRARRRATVRSPSCCGRVTSNRTPSHDRCTSVSRAQRSASRSRVVRCRRRSRVYPRPAPECAQVGQARLAWTVPLRGGPGSAVPERVEDARQRAYGFAAARAAPDPGHATSDVSQECSSLRASHRREEVGASALLELAAGLRAETDGIGGGALALRLEKAATVGLGDQAAKAQSPGGDGGVACNRRAAGAFEHREEGTLGRERGRGVGVVDGGEQRERALVVAARLDG